MTRAHAARFIGVSQRTIGRYMAAGKLLYTRDERTGRVLVRIPRDRAQNGTTGAVRD